MRGTVALPEGVDCGGRVWARGWRGEGEGGEAVAGVGMDGHTGGDVVGEF